MPDHKTAIITGASRGIGAGLVGDTRHSAELSEARPMIETCPLESADEAYARMMSGPVPHRSDDVKLTEK